MELGDWTRGRVMGDSDLAEWLSTGEGRRERFAPILRGALRIMPGPEAGEEEEAAIAQDSLKARHWARGRLRAQGMSLKRVEALEQGRWGHCTRGPINRWFKEFSGLLPGANPTCWGAWTKSWGRRPKPALR
jgi:hypothetical protein